MRKIICLIMIAFMASNFYGCDKPSSGTNADITFAEGQQLVFNVSSAEKTITINFKSTIKWSVSTESEWCGINPPNGDAGDAIIEITAKANETSNERVATIIIQSGEVKKIITLNQKQKGGLAVLHKDIDIVAGGGEFSVTVMSDDAKITVDIKSDWIKEVTRAPIETVLKFVAESNVNLENKVRKGTIIITAGEESETITVTQDVAIPDGESVSSPVQLGDFVIHDRNVGASTDGVAYNYSKDANHPDYVNTSFRGDYHNWIAAQTACQEGYRLPTIAEIGVIAEAMKYTLGRAYVEAESGEKCFFPFSGGFGGEEYTWNATIYWSSDKREDLGGSYPMCLLVGFEDGVFKSVVSAIDQLPSGMVRCIKTVK